MIAHPSARKKDSVRRPSWRDELDLVTRPLALFVAVLACALLLVGISSWRRADKEAVLERATQLRQQALSRYRNVETEKREIQLYQPRFVELRGSGLIGGENRLGWVEAVRQAQAARKLPAVSYEIEPQQALRMDAALDLGDYQLRGSRMQLHLGLVHEVDLFKVLDDLRRAGLFATEACKLRRAAAPPDAGAGPRVQGDCTLVWLSLGPGQAGSDPAIAGSGPAIAGSDPAIAGPDPAIAGPDPRVEAIGRLFSTPGERRQLEAPPVAAQAVPQAAPPPAPPAPVNVDGIVRRSSGRTTVWLNQQPQDNARLSGSASKPLVVVQLPSGRTVTAKPGQRVDMSAGTVKDSDARE